MFVTSLRQTLDRINNVVFILLSLSQEIQAVSKGKTALKLASETIHLM